MHHHSKDHNIIEFITLNPEIGISGVNIMLSMTNLLTMCDMNSPECRLYGVLDIRLSKNGIKLCQYQATPYDNNKRFLVNPEHLTVAFTLPAAITHTHADYYGCHQLFVHLFGHKIWLLWPPTQINLDLYGKYHTQTTPVNLTSRCIDEFNGRATGFLCHRRTGIHPDAKHFTCLYQHIYEFPPWHMGMNAT